jgi:putative peptidoglycan lipid II flippase
LHRRGQLKVDAPLARNLPKTLLCSIAMGAALRGGAWALSGALAGPLLIKTAALTLLVGGGLAVFFGLALASGALEAGEVRRMLKRA